MKNITAIQLKIFTPDQAKHFVAAARATGKKIALTNGCFDILHEGHIYSLSEAAKEADLLIVGVNSDASVRKLKGENRPINSEQTRALVIASLLIVDAVVIFEEETPVELIRVTQPDIYVKGGDYTIDQLAGADIILGYGGKVIINPFLQGFSTTGLIEKIKKL
jgi:D-beta-D-heptose 7-phosphate kinase/D-beta-D-heptose 1-phosphate adenosyltransferase